MSAPANARKVDNVASDRRFGWTKFYEEFADKLLDHKDERSRLVAMVRQVCNSLGYGYLDKSGTAEETTGLPDICPFTTMGTFNRNITSAKRKTIALEIGRFLGVTEPVPDSFDGIPILPNMNSVVFWDCRDIDPLWQVFQDAIHLADSGRERDRRSFMNSYNRILDAAGVGTKATMGLFWMRPRKFLSLDIKSRQYIDSYLGIALPGQIPPPSHVYLELADVLKERFAEANSPVRSFQELSLAAYAPTSEQPSIVDPPDDETDSGVQIQAPLKPVEVSEYTLDDILADGCFLDRSTLEMILNRLKMKKNLILQGPPGTGKTWLAKKLAFALIECKDERRVRRFQFHPNMSYEDFIRGFRPDGDGSLTLVDGPFLESIRDARRDLSNDYVIVIEEINRGNPAQIFGEMLTLLEADKRHLDEALKLGHARSVGERVHIPPNVYVIGTMNVADRSIALVDLALRRRFAFVDLEPTLGAVWRNWVHEQSDVALEFLTIVEARMITLNERIANDRSLGPQFRVGHSYVTPVPGMTIDDPAEWFKQVVETEIGPLLDEYWFDNASDAEKAKSELLNGL